MELLFRKYFWVVNLVFLLGAAYFGAKTVNTFVGAKLAPTPDFGTPGGGPSPVAPTTPKPRLDDNAIYKSVGLTKPEPPPEAAPGTPGGPPAPAVVDLDSQTAVKSGLRVRLVGTMVANRKQWSMANIEDVTSHDVKVYMVGDQIQGAEVIDIERLRVLINNQGRKEFIDQDAGDGSGPVAIAPQPNVPPPPSGDKGDIKSVGDNTYEISKDTITGALTDLNKIAMDARIVPAFKDGVATGFKLFSIRPDSLYSKIGIQNGDVVRRINGYEINSPDKALEVYSKLKEAGRIELELERNGQVQRKTYNVR